MNKEIKEALNDIVYRTIATPTTQETLQARIEGTTEVGRRKAHKIAKRVINNGWKIPSHYLGKGARSVYGRNAAIRLIPTGSREGSTTYQGVLPTSPKF